MIDERDLYQEIEHELAGAVVAEERTGRGFLAFAITLFSLSLLSLAVVGSWIYLSEQGAVPSVAVLLNGTPTPTLVPTETPLPTATPLPTVVPTEAPTEVPVEPTETPEPTATIAPTSTPAPPPTATPLSWPPNVSAPMSTNPSLTSLSLEQVNGATPLQIMTFLGYASDSYKDELAYVRAQTPSYLGDNSLRADQELMGALPSRPLFLVIGQMSRAADFNGQTGTMYLNVPWSDTILQANLSSALLRQSDNASLVINSWIQESGWVLMLARSAELERALLDCRNSLPASNPGWSAPDGSFSCDPLGRLMNESAPIDAVAVVGLGMDGTTLTPLLAQPATPIINRWTYADLGTHGIQLVSSPNLRTILGGSDARANYGLLRLTWNGESMAISADAIFDADTIDGKSIYNLLYLEP